MAKKIFFSFVYIFACIGFVFSIVFISMQFGFLNVKGNIKERNEFFGEVKKVENINDCINSSKDKKQDICDWNKTTEWDVVKNGLLKDKDIIIDVSKKTGVSPRMIVSAVIPEQLRFFTAERESFKKYFEPLKILGSMSKFSLGVSGIKQETANEIEKNINDETSLFYPEQDFRGLISYSDGIDHDKELYNRLTDTKNHYYSYLYTALYLKEIESQWKKSGFDVSKRPDVLVTLFNLGFKASIPKSDPKVAGSVITIGGKKYSFGTLGTLFYDSDELLDVFSR